MPKSRMLLALAGLVALSGCQSSDTIGALAIDTDTTVGSVRTGDLVSEGKLQYRSGNYGKSYALFKKAAEVYPKEPTAWLGLAASADQLGRFDTADTAYKALGTMIGNRPEYYNNLGYSHMLRGDLVGARGYFMRAFDLAPDNVTIANNMQLLRNTASFTGRS
ncbi:tetratricopeptide repeat protein [Mangrovibrevibacter kandeliae]|uniref:tetratricopeptide repeat protein n=1 Tax=Mangrovibrevibacter kandeliae TaxID=2968473 RepID=UPI0021184BC1|nr:tetratricopeptide repeat protein [Aurantimonas sp. CSK15Z-1]MCQ8784098.1 tetratricopeptide repeat protein [Aurantimonas sp. CSK15Z-1]